MDILQLEEAARIVLAPPDEVSSEARIEAETLLLKMKNSPRPYQFCQAILDSNCSSYLLFQSVVTIQEAVIREWLVLSPDEKYSIQRYLMEYTSRQTHLPLYIYEHLFKSLAIMIKRGVLENGGKDVFDKFIHEISLLMFDTLKIELGCALLSSLIQEFSSSNGRNSLSMPLNFHIKCKKLLEEDNLLINIFTMVIQRIDSYTGGDCVNLDTRVLSCLLSLSLDIFSWDFGSSNVSSEHLVTSANYFVPLKPPTTFRVIFLNPGLIALFIKVFTMCRTNTDLARTSCLCLSQLASLSGPIFASSSQSIGYLQCFIESFLPALNDWESYCNHTLYGVVCVFRQLASAFPRDHYVSLKEDVLKSLIGIIASICGACAERIARLESVQEDVSLLEEALCYILEVVVRFIDGPMMDEFTTLIKLSMADFVSTYFTCKMNQPYGIRQYHTDGEQLNVDLDDDDRDKYSEELSYIGIILRHLSQTSLPLMLSLFLQFFSDYINIIHSLDKDSNLLIPTLNKLEALCENIHWLYIICTYTLTDVAEGEETTIPSVLLEESRQNNYINLSCSCQDLINNANYSSDSCLYNIDPLVAVIVCLCKWSLIEEALIDKGLKDIISPQVCKSAIWSLVTVMSTYLMSNVNTEGLSQMFCELIIDDTEESKWLLVFVLHQIHYNMCLWYSEETLAMTCVKGLSSLSEFNKTRAAYICNADIVWLLMKTFVHGQDASMKVSSSLQKQIIISLIHCVKDTRQEQFVSELLKPLISQFALAFASRDEKKLVPLIESLDGVALSCHSTIIKCVFSSLFPILCDCVHLLETFCDHVDIPTTTLSFLSHVAENFIIFLDDEDIHKLYGVFSKMIDVFSKCYISKFTGGSTAHNDDKLDELVVLLQTLTHLTTKDYIELQISDDSSVPVSVVFKGLCTILPAINEDRLKYPDVCKKFYEFLHYICDIFPEYFVALCDQVLHYTFNLILLGFTQFGPEISLWCVECAESVSSHFPTKDTIIITQYNGVLLNALFSNALNMSFQINLTAVAGAIYQLMCSLNEKNINLTDVLSLPASYLDNDVKVTSLTEMLNKISSNSTLSGTREHKKKFIAYFLEILPNLRYVMM